MIVRAPGKLVVSGAYAVLEGAPAIVAAVDRYVSADAGRPATLVTPEVRAAIGDRPAPFFDASALRDGARKLGLGSSAAILVASLGALRSAERGALPDRELAEAVFAPALAAHARAQAGGSGIDVAASSFGGVLVAARVHGGLSVTPGALPTGLHLEVWCSPEPASTPALLAQVAALKAAHPGAHARWMQAQAEAAEAARDALTNGSAAGLIDALCRQHVALRELGRSAGAPIVTPAMAELHALAQRQQACLLPSGAGGGDASIFAGLTPSSAAFAERALSLHQRPLRVTLGARGVHQEDA